MFKLLLAVMLLWVTQATQAAQTLTVGMLVVNGKHRDAMRVLTTKFEAENPGITISLLERPNDQYHQWMRTWETSSADVVWWFAGYQLNQFAAKGSVEPITDIWQAQSLDQSFPGLKNAVSYNAEVYALPLSYYQWGFYYKKSVFEKLKLAEPKTWDEFLAVCAALKAANVTPLGLSTRASWPAASWFSYFNLRLNGLDFHRQLLGGKVSFKDARVRAVLGEWKKLIDSGYFQASSQEHEWKGVLPYMYRDQVGMLLIGNFVLSGINRPVSEFGFFRFPVINSDMPQYEEAPTDVLFINRKSTHKDAAKKFLSFMAKADNQFIFNEAIGIITPHVNAPKSTNEFVKKGAAMLGSAKGVSQYFDRDTSMAMAHDGFQILGEFARTGEVEKTLGALEEARVKHFKP